MNINLNNNYISKIFNRHSVVQQGVNLYPNLAPLKADTVSFSGGNNLSKEAMQDAPTLKSCFQVHNNAEPARYYLNAILDKYIKPLNRNSELFTYTTRTKSPSSIREKVASVFDKHHNIESVVFARQLGPLITKYYDLNMGLKGNDLVKSIINEVEYSVTSGRTATYENAEHYLSDIIDTYQEAGYMTKKPSVQETDAQIKKQILRELNYKKERSSFAATEYIPPNTITGIKHYANDIIGARITMKESDSKYCDAIIDALARAVEDGVLTITSIENNLPHERQLPKGKKVEDYQYASPAKLLNLSEVSSAPLESKTSKSGYLAIHINIELNDEILKKYNGVYDGYKGEIQILGADVEKLKDVEDLCYKLKGNKTRCQEGFTPFREHFQEYYSGKNTKKAFDKYTYALYLAQRAIPSNSERSDSFPSIEDLGFAGKVPPELDFNLLAALKKQCASSQEQIDNQQKDQNNSSDVDDIFRTGNINTMRQAIDAKFKKMG